MDGEWRSELPDGRDVVVRRRRDYWFVRCGQSEARGQNLDVALARAIRAETEIAGHADKVDYPAWIRTAADRLAPTGSHDALKRPRENELLRELLEIGIFDEQKVEAELSREPEEGSADD